MSTTNLKRNRDLAMRAKLSTSDESMRQFLNDWLLGHEVFDRYDAAQRAQLVVDLQSLNGVTGMSARDWHVTAAAVARSLFATDGIALQEWINYDLVCDANGNEIASLLQAIKYWDSVVGSIVQFLAGGTDDELLRGIDRMVCP